MDATDTALAVGAVASLILVCVGGLCWTFCRECRQERIKESRSDNDLENMIKQESS